MASTAALCLLNELPAAAVTWIVFAWPHRPARCRASVINVGYRITSLPAVLPLFAASWSPAGILQVYFLPVLSAMTIVRMPGSAGGSAASPARQHWLLMRCWMALKCVTTGAVAGLTISIYSDDVLCLLLAVQELYRGVCAPNQHHQRILMLMRTTLAVLSA
jgi:hypothetical protein